MAVQRSRRNAPVKLAVVSRTWMKSFLPFTAMLIMGAMIYFSGTEMGWMHLPGARGVLFIAIIVAVAMLLYFTTLLAFTRGTFVSASGDRIVVRRFLTGSGRKLTQSIEFVTVSDVEVTVVEDPSNQDRVLLTVRNGSESIEADFWVASIGDDTLVRVARWKDDVG